MQNKKILKLLKNRRIILASGSPRRIKILKTAGLKFNVLKSNLNEKLLVAKHKKLKASQLVKVLSLAKIKSVLKRYNRLLKGNEVIIGFDTIVICKNKIIDKAKSKKDALKKLLFLSNKKHKVYTGFSILDVSKKKEYAGFEITYVHMKSISRADAIKYINTKEPFGKAGCYAIQGKGKHFIKKINGDYLNVVGLPLDKFFLMFQKHFN